MICCLCRKHVAHPILETRPSGAFLSLEVWAYCRRCWRECMEQEGYLPIEPPHGHSCLIAGAQVVAPAFELVLND